MDASHRQNPQSTSAPAAAAAAAPMTSAEEEAIKKNTDCVYFLASPLTCKKGSECEYRHSDNARLNPRDCWYWLNGNCLNPKCAFRHPPLDGLLGPQVPNHVESFIPPPVHAVAPQVPYMANKQGVPCIFFQKGTCLKGDRCPFLHAPNSMTNKVPQKQGVLPATEVTSKKTFGGLERCTTEKNTQQKNIPKTGELAKPVALANNHFLAGKNIAPTSVIYNDPLKYKSSSISPNGNPASRSSQMQHQHGFDDYGNIHNKDEEISREASPGFDVLVDDELRDSDYYPVEDQYRGAGDHERSEYDIEPSADYPIGDVDQDIYRDAHGYESYDRHATRYGWEQRGASSERKPGRSGLPERRSYGSTDSSDQIDVSDLRNRLSKQRRVNNGLRSVISHDYTRERHGEEKSYRGSWRERNNLSSRESSLGSRLRGRIKLPGRSSSPTDVTENLSDREMDRNRDRGTRLSHGRPQLLSHEGRLQDRMQGRMQEDHYVGRNSRGPPSRGDILSENNFNFAGPKSLAELKGKKGIEGNEQRSLGKRRFQALDDQQQPGRDHPSFAGPMPLKEILKRKKRASDNEDNNQQEITTSHEAQREDLHPPSGNNGGAHENKSGGDEDEGYEDGMIPDEDGEGYDQQEGDYNYEQVDGGDVNIDEAENDEEYLDEDDDDFAKKMGVVFS